MELQPSFKDFNGETFLLNLLKINIEVLFRKNKSLIRLNALFYNNIYNCLYNIIFIDLFVFLNYSECIIYYSD
ncbi:hypothetical protein Cva_01710 [Caedimonas varicaedens]|uniref:Uncharacterized protein n=1 Tax=Caedimonas varicaedens TaxID=1629334 RepID=A0A0K8MEZ6_9PROT|nr:hypothetical protein Cva_01710 [Caedimonas varicaedens]